MSACSGGLYGFVGQGSEVGTDTDKRGRGSSVRLEPPSADVDFVLACETSVQRDASVKMEVAAER